VGGQERRTEQECLSALTGGESGEPADVRCGRESTGGHPGWWVWM
jgi:hypothetical protein